MPLPKNPKFLALCCTFVFFSTTIFLQKPPPEKFYKKGALKNFVKFMGKHLR